MRLMELYRFKFSIEFRYAYFYLYVREFSQIYISIPNIAI